MSLSALRLLAFTALTAFAFVVSGCSGSLSSTARDIGPPDGDIQWLFPSQPIPGIEQTPVGSGPEAAVILSTSEGPRPRRIVVYLHKWSPLPPSAEQPAVEALIAAGNTVIYPVYQDMDSTVADYLPNAVRGVRSALRHLDYDPQSLATVGESTGGALAFDLAAVAGEEGLPTPRAAIAISPGRDPQGRMPRPDYGQIAPSTWLMAVDLPASRIPGARAEARRMLRLATAVSPSRKALHRLPAPPEVRNPHDAQPDSSSWHPLMRYIARARQNRTRS